MPNAKGSDDTGGVSRLTLLLRQENTLAHLFKNHVGGFLVAASGGSLPPQEPPPRPQAAWLRAAELVAAAGRPHLGGGAGVTGKRPV